MRENTFGSSHLVNMNGQNLSRSNCVLVSNVARHELWSNQQILLLCYDDTNVKFKYKIITFNMVTNLIEQVQPT